jgi:hypothetical protein
MFLNFGGFSPDLPLKKNSIEGRASIKISYPITTFIEPI